ncbi:hypothetical protein WJX73_010550 [Symbiochloris irregularis]|uniref:50S ribosomal protein L25 n=1 Tax=Symbiochloris irregularis TaxID=706552 RepID=A0AAW1NY83_9CHLO
MRRLSSGITNQLRSIATSVVCQAEPAAVVAQQQEAHQLSAIPRRNSGTKYSELLRKESRTPATLFSLPNNDSRLLSVDSKQITKLVERVGPATLASTLCHLTVVSEDGQPEVFPVLTRTVHRNAKTDMVENVAFMHCPPERKVEVPVPIKIVGEDTSPAMKRGGYVNRVRKHIRCLCPGDNIPAYVEVNVGGLEVGEKVGLEALALPQGVVHLETVLVQPVVKMAGRKT